MWAAKTIFLIAQLQNFIKKEVQAGDSTKPHCFQDSDFHKKIVMVKQKSFMKVVGTITVLESWNVNLLGEPLALNFIASMVDSLDMELRQKGCTEPVKLIKVIWSPPLSLLPPKPLNLNLHARIVGRSQLSYKGCSCLPTIRHNFRKFKCVIPVFRFQP